jgi:hypothetical protein
MINLNHSFFYSILSKFYLIKKKFLFLLFLFPLISSSQTINGKVLDSLNNPIFQGSILIKKSSDNEKILQFSVIRNGKYSLTLNDYDENIIIELSSYGFKTVYHELKNIKSNEKYTVDFYLEKDDDIKLDEVILKAKKATYKINGDTTSFDVTSYRDGTERKVEDLIKKLPGIEINDKTGKIKYNGKSIETVKIEGDDLFGSNYSLGTKNINIDIVEKIEAIENYSENPLLKGIENSDKVILNLKIKENKLSFSGDANLGFGYGDDFVKDVSVNLLSISKNYKSFITASNNNVGLNKSPVNYFSSTRNFENDQNYRTQKIVTESTFSSVLDEDRSNVNDIYFGSYNAVFKIKKRTSVKVNFFYVRDKIESLNNINSIFNLENETILNSDSYFTTKKPELYSLDLDLKFNSSKNSLLEYFLKYNYETINTNSNVVFNNEDFYNTNLNSKDNFFKNKLIFTQKIAKNKALVAESNLSFNKTPQSYFLTPLPNFVTNNNSDSGSQFSEYSKRVFDLKISFLGSFQKHKYSTSLGFSDSNTNFNSSFKEDSFDENIIEFENDLKFKKTQLFLNSEYNYKVGKFSITPSFLLSKLVQKLKDSNLDTNLSNSDFLKTFQLLLNYKLNNISSLNLGTGYVEEALGEEYLYSNNLLTSYRNFQSNSPSLEIQKDTKINFYYRLNDLYNQFQINVGTNYSYSKNNFFSNNSISENFSTINFFFSDEGSSNSTIYFFTEKFFSKLSLTARLRTNYSILKYKNFVNDSEIRDNKSNFFTNDFFLKTVFNRSLNFENNFRFNLNKFESNINQTNQNIAITESFKVIYKIKNKYFAQFSSEYIIPNIDKKKENYLFLDASLRYISENKKHEINFIAKNLLNNNKFIQVFNSDFSTTTFENNLISRYFIISGVFNF